ncbi:MAG: lipase family protein [Chitinophagaceae bacterium]|nr:lipase family protein [Chitinophagaceae bacterium]
MKWFFVCSVLGIILPALWVSCKNSPRNIKAPFLTAREAVDLCRASYKDHSADTLAAYLPDMEIVFLPAESVNGNFAYIARKKNVPQYAVVIRGSIMEFSNDGFNNFLIHNLQIFNQQPWPYCDTVTGAFVSRGSWIAFQNLLRLTDRKSGLSLKDFLEKELPRQASLLVTGHSLGGNLSNLTASYLKKELKSPVKNNMHLITFGAPASGNEAFVKDLEQKFPTGERYVIDKDIAPAFPDYEAAGEIARKIGLDSIWKPANLPLNTGHLLDVAGVIVRQSGWINEKRKYKQSPLHLRLLNAGIITDTSRPVPEGLLSRAYRYHSIEAYASLLK